MTRAYRQSTLALGCCLLVPAILRADPVVAPAMATPASVTFLFSLRITQAFGPLETLFGRSFVSGDTLTGRLTFDGTAGPDQDPWVAHGLYDVPSARIELDVPSGFALDAGRVDYFRAETLDDIPATDDEVIFYANTCCHPTGIGFVNVDVLWTDPTQLALTSDALPSRPEALGRFRRVALGLLAGDESRIALFGEMALTPVPEPSSLLLLATGAGIVARRAAGRGGRRRT